jgi:hypothetical protein
MMEKGQDMCLVVASDEVYSTFKAETGGTGNQGNSPTRQMLK